MAKDIVQEAVEQAEAMKEAAYENAKSILVDAMSTNLKAAVSEAIGEKITEDGNPKGANLNVNYDPEGLKDLEGDDLTDEGDGPAIVEAGVDEGDDFGGDKGDESRSHRDYEGDDDEEDENEGDEFGGNKGDESKSREDYEEGAVWEDEDEDDAIDIDIDVDDDEEEDIDEVLEIIEDDDDDEDVDVDVDVDEQDDDEELEEGRTLHKKVEASLKENRKLRRENRRYEKALTFLKKRIDEVNLFNARLAAASDLMRKVSLTKDEKERVIEHFDKARTVGEVKRTFRALSEGYRASSRGVKKQRVARPNIQSVLTEEQKNQTPNQQVFDRMSELAGL